MQPNHDQSLPRVLLVGDSITWGYTEAVRDALRDKAEIHRIPVNGQETGFGLLHLAEWVGDAPWDVIHFNWGLWDVCYRNPEAATQGNRDKIHGKLTTTPEQYEINLRELVARLKSTGAKLIWATTTPVPEGEIGRFAGDEIRYNAIALKIMMENDVAVDDLHAYALPRLSAIQIPGGDVHFTEEGSEHLAEQVAHCILGALQ